NGADLTGQDALVEAAIAGTQDGSAIVRKSSGDAEARRDDVPRVQRAQPVDHLTRVISFGVDGIQILTDGATVIVRNTEIYRDEGPHRHRIARERSSRDEHAAGVGGRRRDCLKGLPVVVDIPDAAGDDARTVVLTSLDLGADLPLVVSAEPRR